MASKIYLKLRDKGSIFHDSTQGITVTGKAVVAFTKNPFVTKAILAGVVDVVSDEEAEKAVKAQNEKATADSEGNKTTKKELSTLKGKLTKSTNEKAVLEATIVELTGEKEEAEAGLVTLKGVIDSHAEAIKELEAENAKLKEKK